MFVYHLHRALLAATLSNVASLTTAQNSCGKGISSLEPDARLNSTGKVKFQFDDNVDFYFSVTYNDSRVQSTDAVTYTPEVMHDIQSWISSPNDISGYACVYMLTPLNASSPEGGMNGCEDVLSKECIDQLSTLTLPKFVGNDSRCPTIDEAGGFKELCGGSKGWVSTSWPIDLSNSTCAISSPQGVSIPDNYETHAAIGIGMAPGQSDNYSTFDYYDLYVRQTVPYVIASSTGRTPNGGLGQSNTQVVCVAPDTVLPGSRVPDLKFGTWAQENGAAGSVNWRLTESLAVVVAATVSLGLIIF